MAATAVNLYIDAEAGSDGDTLTTTNLASATHGSGATWTLSTTPMTGFTIETDAERALGGRLVSVSSTEYDDTGSTRGFQYDHSQANKEAYCGFSGVNNASCGFFYVWNATADFNYFSMGGLRGNTGGIYNYLNIVNDPNLYARAEFDQSPYVGSAIYIQRNHWYWVTLDYNRAGTATLRLYDPKAWTLVGESTGTLGNYACDEFRIGRQGSESGTPSGVSYFDDMVVDWTNHAFPLLPGEATDASNHAFVNKSQANTQTATTIEHNHTPGAAATLAIVSVVVAGTTQRSGGAPTIDGTTATQASTTQGGTTGYETSCEVWYVCKAFDGSQFTVSIPNDGGLTCHVEVVTACAPAGYTSALATSGTDGDGSTSSNGLTLTPSADAIGDFGYARVGCGEGNAYDCSGNMALTYSNDHGAYISDGRVWIASATGSQSVEWTWSADDGAAVAVVFTTASSAQYARPAADRTDGSWVNSAGTPDNVNLFSYIDETTYSDADYIRSSASPSADTCTIDLSSIATPQAGTVTLRVRARSV